MEKGSQNAFRHFRLAQGDSAKEDVLMQDDEYIISLVVKGSKHVSARCFFVECKIHQKKGMIAHFPTAKMVADFSAKPL